MNDRKLLGMTSLFFASVCIRFPLIPMAVNQNSQSSVFRDLVIPIIVITLSVLLFVFRIIQMFVGFIVEDLPALRQISMKIPKVSTRS